MAMMTTILAAGCGSDGEASAEPDNGHDAHDDATRDTGASDDPELDADPHDEGEATQTVPDAADSEISPDPWPALDVAWRPAADDFECLTEWTAVRGFYLTNVAGYLDEAVAVAEGGFASEVPPGTIVQLVPLEAMVKLAPGALPETDDWEYLMLTVRDGETEITQRGGAEVSNPAGSCFGCHVSAQSRDYICEDTGLCGDAAVPRSVVDQLVAGDRRCR